MASYPAYSSNITGGYYLDNLVSIAKFLMANGYSRAAAAGVAGGIAGESGGNPEAIQPGGPGRGLIQWSYPAYPSPNPNIITGNPQADWQAQLTDLLTYANTNSAEAVKRGGVSLDKLKQATDPRQAATWWSAFEGPATPGSDVRNAVTDKVYAALGGTSTQTPTSPATPPTTGTDPSLSNWLTQNPVTSIVSGLSGMVSGIGKTASALDKFGQLIALLFRPSFWLRVGAFFTGILTLVIGLRFLQGSLS